MKKSRACFTVILTSTLLLISTCDKTNLHNANLTETVANPAQQNDQTEFEETEAEEEDDCHDPDCSPVAAEGVILFSDYECRLLAVDAKTGKRRWFLNNEK